MTFNPIQQIEEGLELLRRQTLHAWLQYMLGAAPFLLALLWFVRDMILGYYAGRCAAESLLCTLAFFWCSAWKARFAGTLAASMDGREDGESDGGFWSCLYLQAILQTLRLAAISVAAISLFPLPWTSSFFRNAAIEASRRGATLRSVAANSSRRASSGIKNGSLGLSIMLAFGLVVFTNLFSLVALLPELLKMFTGYESEWTRNTAGAFSWNLLSIALALTWFLIDPLMQAYTVVRSFYSDARTDGRDLMVQLRRLSAVPLLVFVLAGMCRPATGAAPQSLSRQEFNQAVDKALQADEYGWQRARNDAVNTLDNSFAMRMAKGVNAAVDTAKSWFSAFRRWIRRVLTKSPETNGPKPPKLGSGSEIKSLLYALIALVFAGVIILLVRNTPPRFPVEKARVSPAHIRDLAGENVLASDLPDEEWLRMAKNYLAKGEFRLALRAMYMSNLAFLGSLQLIRIARAKSNAVYERELRPTARTAEVCRAFAHTNRNFEKIWYGFHEVTPELVELFERDIEAIRTHERA